MSVIWEFLKAIPALIGLFKQVYDLWSQYQQNQMNEEQRRRESAIDQLKNAKTPEDVWKANDEITKNLP